MTDTNQQQQQSQDDNAINDKVYKKVLAENERLKEIAAKYDALKKGIDAKADADRAEVEQAHKLAAERATALEAQLATVTAELGSTRDYLAEQIKGALESVADERQRAEWSAAIDGLDSIRQHKVLRAIQSSAARAAAVSGGAPGLRRSPELSRAQLAARGPVAEQARLRAVMASLATKGD